MINMFYINTIDNKCQEQPSAMALLRIVYFRLRTATSYFRLELKSKAAELNLDKERLQNMFTELIQYFKTLFTKMTVEPKNVFQPVMPHGDKADAIDKAQFFSAQTEPEFKSQLVPWLIDP